MDRESALALGLTLAVILVAAYRHAVAPPGVAPLADGGTQVTATPDPDYDLDELLARANPGQGRVLYLQCQACHPLVPGERSTRGPNLAGLLGRPVAGDPGYGYSDEVRALEFRWTPEQLDRLLRRPGDVLPRSRMTMLPLGRPEERADLIAYLQSRAGG